ncbi:MAG: isoprenyl transferase [Beijerinckiaceae bacterium]
MQDEFAGDESPDAPRHVAIIMDGNGRWASKRGLPRLEGHRRGVEALRRTVRAAIELDIRYLTIYSFSSENWRRPAEEIGDLFGLLRIFVRRDLADLHARAVKVRFIGSRQGLPSDIADLLSEAENLTRANKGLTLIVAFNYGARQEILAAARAIAEAALRGEVESGTLDEKGFEGFLETAGIPDPDLLIRTSGEQRLSNFLLWQSAYAELVFMPVLWPDFDRAALEAAINEFRGRDRRFGGLASRAPSLKERA